MNLHENPNLILVASQILCFIVIKIAITSIIYFSYHVKYQSVATCDWTIEECTVQGTQAEIIILLIFTGIAHRLSHLKYRMYQVPQCKFSTLGFSYEISLRTQEICPK